MDGFSSPEDAALDDWPAAAEARVMICTVVGDRAEVVLEVGPDYRYWVYCVKRNEGWQEVSSANGPSEGWADPDAFDWLS